MTDEVASRPWQLDPAAAAVVRLEATRRALHQRDAHQALVEVEELLDAQPDHAEALHLAAVTFMELRDFGPALDAWHHLHRLKPGGPASWLQAARCAYEVCEVDLALGLARRALDAAPELAEAWWLVGRALEHTGAAQEAARHAHYAYLLSPLQFPPPFTFDREGWLEIVTNACARLGEDARELVNGVEVVLEELPPLDVLRTATPPLTPRTAALLDPPPDAPEGTLPGTLRVFTRNLAWLEHVEQMVAHLAWTIEQEALDWLDDEDG